MKEVVQHPMGCLKNHLPAKTRRAFGTLELLGFIEETRQGLVPLIVPLTLLRHHLNCYPVLDWVLVPSAASGAPAGVFASVSQGADAAESRLSSGRLRKCWPMSWHRSQFCDIMHSRSRV
jgi:hypothetical protein